MTDQEKRQLRPLLDEQAKARARKTRARIQADPKHSPTPAELGEQAARRDNDGTPKKEFLAHLFTGAPGCGHHEVQEYSLDEIEAVFDSRIYTAAEQMGLAQTEKFYSDDDNDLVVVHRIR
jgi:hypothetical protein